MLRPRHCVLLLLVVPAFLLAWQHRELEEVQEAQRKELRQITVAHVPDANIPPPQSPPGYPHPPMLPQTHGHLGDAESESVEFVDGEAIGRQSSARLCIVMPVRSNSLPRVLRNVRSWATAQGIPCSLDVATTPSKDAYADACFFHSQSYESSRDISTASEILRALNSPVLVQPAERSSRERSRLNQSPTSLALVQAVPRHCFGAVRFLAARIPLSDDVYTIYPTHNFSGPNAHFMGAFAALHRINSAGLARYTSFQLMEHDTYPFRPGWLEALEPLTRRKRREWVQGSRSLCLRATENEHINGNAMYSLDAGFFALLKNEMAKRFDSWAFDVLIGHWLLRSHPGRIRDSPHIMSISTFQRNRELSCSVLRTRRKMPSALPCMQLRDAKPLLPRRRYLL
jgi:hypothetical protein